MFENLERSWPLVGIGKLKIIESPDVQELLKENGFEIIEEDRRFFLQIKS